MIPVTTGNQIKATDLDQVINYLIGTILSDATVTAIPSGEIKAFAGVTAPAGFYLCDGSAKSRTTDSVLFNAITIQTTGNTHATNIIDGIGSTANMQAGMPISGSGIPANTTITSVDSGTQIHISNATTSTLTGTALVVAPYGVGDGSTTFNVPDGRGRNLVGAGQGTGLSNRILGAQPGGTEETHTLSAGEMPTHNHGVSDSGHVHGVADSGHAHSAAHASSSGGVSIDVPPSNGNFLGNDTPGQTVNSAFTGISVQNATTGVSTQNNGSSGAHNNMQPGLVVNFIIKR